MGPGKDTHGTPVPTQWEGRGWPTTRYTRHHQHDKTKVTVTRLSYQQFGWISGRFLAVELILIHLARKTLFKNRLFFSFCCFSSFFFEIAFAFQTINFRR